MEQRKISEFVTFIPGINTTRSEKQFGTTDIDYYDQADFEYDYRHEEGFLDTKPTGKSREEYSLDAGDVVISNSMRIAATVGNRNAGKILSLNFIKVKFNNDKLDKSYFIYLFNTFSGVKRQKERELQGSSAALRLPVKSLNQIMIPMIDIEEQVKIGKAYIEMLKMQSKLNKYAGLLEQFVEVILEENLKEMKENEQL